MRFCARLFLLGCYVSVQGCSAVGVPLTDDPHEKLSQSLELMKNQSRPIPAERLIRESLRIYQAKGDSLGLADAYRMYGIFFRSSAVANWELHYRRDGFMDRSASYDQRFERSIEYFGKARDIYRDRKLYDNLSNIYWNMAYTYWLMKQTRSVCASLDRSLENYHQALREDPQAHFIHPSKFKSYGEFVDALKTGASCP